jgi:hypothetical protein
MFAVILTAFQIMKLPASLTPWAKHLQIFPEEISLTLGNYVQKLSPFFSPINSLEEISDGEPNGYDGVARRGIYERLLLSELALADGFGDEFIRRAVMGEHLFLNLAKVNPGAKRVTVALFDAGAMQIGAPRIAHLAAFIVLARRAEAANSSFLWGVLQDEKNLVISDDTESSIKILLESRTAKEVGADDISRWRENLSDFHGMSDIWLIGSEKLSQIAESKGFSHLYVDEVIELEKRELELKIKSASGAERQTFLELPNIDICTRLLRNPFETLPTIHTQTGTLGGNVTNFFFDATGTKLFAKLDSENLLVFPVENNRVVTYAHPTTYRSTDAKKLIAVGRFNKAIAVASKVDSQTIRLEYRKFGFKLPQGLYRNDSENFTFPDDEKKLLPLFAISPRYSHQHKAAFLDADGRLFSLDEKSIVKDGVVGYSRLLATNVLAVTRTDNEFMYVGCEDGNEYHHLVIVSDSIERKALSGRRLTQAFFGRGEYGKKALAIEDTGGNWNILEDKDNIRIMPRPKGKYVGVYRDHRFAPNAGLFELLEDGKTLEFTWAYGRRKHILTATEEIKEIAFNQKSPLLAYQTESELVIFSLTHKAAVGRYSK